MGLYQSYLSITITLIVIRCILYLLDGRSWREVLAQGLRGIGMLAVGALMYLCLIILVPRLSGMALSSGKNQSLDNMFLLTPGRVLALCGEAWTIVVTGILHAPSIYLAKAAEGMQALVLVFSGLLVLPRLIRRDVQLPGKLLSLALQAFLPLGANVSHVLSNGISHGLMYDAFWMVYLLLLLLADRQRVWQEGRKGYPIWISAGLVGVILWGNVQMANGVYTAKRLVEKANLSLFTRITYSMEQTPDYVPGETPVVFLGRPTGVLTELPEEFQGFQLIYALDPFVVGSGVQAHYQCYYEYVLLNPAVIAPDARKYELMQREDVANMPCYPADGAIAMVDGTMVVKLGE